MKVIFLKDALPTAHAGDVKVVKNGFGRNYLLPRGIAVLAGVGQLRQSEKLRKAADERLKREAEDWRNLVAGIRGTPVTVLARAGQSGRLFGSVTTQAIAAQLSASTGRPIDRRGIRIAAPIRQLGSYTVGLRLFEGVETEVRVIVKPEGELAVEAPSAKRAAKVAESLVDEVAKAAADGSGGGAADMRPESSATPETEAPSVPATKERRPGRRPKGGAK